MAILNWRSTSTSNVRKQIPDGLARESSWWCVMGYEAGPPRSLAQVERQFRRLAALAHPDRGGDALQMQRLLRARAQARVQLSR
jgi:hypothetical protein